MRNYVTHKTTGLRSAEEQVLFEADFAAGTSLAMLELAGHAALSFDIARYPFHDLICDMLVAKGVLTAAERAEMGDLENLHRYLPATATQLDSGELNEITRLFYDQDDAFLQAYHGLVAEVLLPQVAAGDLLFQRTPTLRFHFPNAAGFAWKPRYHSDIMLGHPPQEINVWLPFTRTYDSNTMRLAPLAQSREILEGMDLDFTRFATAVQEDEALQKRCEAISAPVTMAHGQFILFDSRCLHCTQYNVSPTTRVSMDFRVMPAGAYEKIKLAYRGTGRLRMPFLKGHYFDERTAADLMRA